MEVLIWNWQSHCAIYDVKVSDILSCSLKQIEWMTTSFLWTFEQRLGYIEHKGPISCHYILLRTQTFGRQILFFLQIFLKFYIWTMNWVTRYINCYCSYKGCRNLTTTMKIGHKFRRQNRRQSLTCSHRPKHMRKQNLPRRNTRSVFMARYSR